MSATAQTIQPRPRYALAPFLIAVLVALSIGATAGSLATRAIVDRSRSATAVTGWDPQKLSAMEGLQRAAAIRSARTAWDPSKLRAMPGREQAEAINLGEAG